MRTARPFSIEGLETRRLLTITPAHVALAERSLNETTVDNNLYTNGAITVTWAGVNGATTTVTKADCTTYVTALLKQAYGWTNSQWTSMFGSSSPNLTTYYNDAVADVGLDGFKPIADAKVGDYFICKYPTGSSARGHLVMLDSLPTLVSTTSTYRAYNVSVIDVTGSVHTNDTRAGANADGTNDSGVGRGDIRLYTDLAGNLDHWAWGTRTTSTTYDATNYPCTFFHVPALSIKSPGGLSAVATGETRVALSWSDNSTIEDGTVVQRSGDNGATWATIGDVGRNVSTYTDTAVTPGAYAYRVYAVAGASVSGYAAAASVVVSPVTPVTPTNVSAVLSGSTIDVTWQDNATNEVRYVLERSVNGGDFTPLATTSANATTFYDTATAADSNYQYRVYAQTAYASGEAAVSPVVDRTADLPPLRGRPIMFFIAASVPPQSAFLRVAAQVLH